MDCLRVCLLDHWPVAATFVAALVPSLLVGLSRSRRNGVGVVAAIVRALDRASLLTHRDARGTMKLPGKASQPLS